MTRAGCLVISSLLLTAAVLRGHAGDRFGLTPLPTERQVVHVLNRLTFGATPEDVDRVRRIGIDAWIDQQLHPERVTENPALDAKLRQFQTLDMPTWQLLQKYPAVPAALTVNPPSQVAFIALTQQQRNILTSCSVDERLVMLAALDPNTRGLVLAASPPP